LKNQKVNEKYEVAQINFNGRKLLSNFSSLLSSIGRHSRKLLVFLELIQDLAFEKNLHFTSNFRRDKTDKRQNEYIFYLQHSSSFGNDRYEIN
jgi:hypothetical protein